MRLGGSAVRRFGGSAAEEVQQARDLHPKMLRVTTVTEPLNPGIPG
ncbi:hypothetical protein [Nonomuraea guangzhouensis]|uniref:Uncharacterized protein n=1 Tax=Nonomuraea guangzhouensis TaxID=1291555 RepID=A0ABW4GRX5_9ACTN|nr:hypothetical protein [Nonomuraea guangzhouensis]